MRHPRWFWATLGIFGIIVLAVAVWAVVTLVHSANYGTATTLVLDDNTNNDAGAGNEAVNNYVDLCQYFGQKKSKDYASFFSSSSSFCCGVK